MGGIAAGLQGEEHRLCYLSKLNYSATRNTALQHILELLLIRTNRFTYYATDRGANLKMMMKGLKEHFDRLWRKCYNFHSDKQG